MPKWMYNFMMLMLAVCFALVLFMFYWLLRPYNILDIKEPMAVENKVIEAGKQVEYEIDYCKYMDLEARIIKNIYNGSGRTLEIITTRAEAGCAVGHGRVTIPADVEPGEYHIQLIFTYYPNPIRKVEYTHQTEKFVVVRGE